ncbi:MAG: hypothetical protein IKH09_05450 [Clostridia bacterium]|nr:hypothetical protein [Clostridia bacterium]
MKPLKCEFCNGNLVVDSSLEFAVCEYCGVKYSKDALHNKIIEIRGVVETVQGEAEKQRLLNKAETLKKLNKYGDAISVYNNLIKEYPDDYHIYLELLKTDLNCYRLDWGLINDALKLCGDPKLVYGLFDEFQKLYGKEIHTEESSYTELDLEWYDLPTIDYFTFNLLNQEAELKELIRTKSFHAFIDELKRRYVYLVRSHQMVPRWSRQCNYESGFGDKYSPLFRGEIIPLEKTYQLLKNNVSDFNKTNGFSMFSKIKVKFDTDYYYPRVILSNNSTDNRFQVCQAALFNNSWLYCCGSDREWIFIPIK